MKDIVIIGAGGNHLLYHTNEVALIVAPAADGAVVVALDVIDNFLLGYVNAGVVGIGLLAVNDLAVELHRLPVFAAESLAVYCDVGFILFFLLLLFLGAVTLVLLLLIGRSSAGYQRKNHQKAQQQRKQTLYGLHASSPG